MKKRLDTISRKFSFLKRFIVYILRLYNKTLSMYSFPVQLPYRGKKCCGFISLGFFCRVKFCHLDTFSSLSPDQNFTSSLVENEVQKSTMPQQHYNKQIPQKMKREVGQYAVYHAASNRVKVLVREKKKIGKKIREKFWSGLISPIRYFTMKRDFFSDYSASKVQSAVV